MLCAQIGVLLLLLPKSKRGTRLLARRNQRTNTSAEADLTAFNHSLDIRTTGMDFAASAPIVARRITILTERLQQNVFYT